MKVLVTGATGFLGGWVARELIQAGHRLRLLVRDGRRPPGLPGTVEVVKGDILAPASIAAAVAGTQAVVHAAGFVSLRARDEAALYRINVEGTRNVLTAACERGVRALHTSSIATIGTTETPVERAEDERLDLADAAGYPYAASKHQGEAVALGLARAGGDVVVLNPGLLLGPGDVNFTSTRIVRDHLQGRLRFSLPGGTSFADVRDVAAAYATALQRGQAGQRYILAGSNLTYADLLARLRGLTGLPGAWPLAPTAARWFGLWSQLSAAFLSHPFEELNPASVDYGSRFNYCRSDRAARELGYRQRPLPETLRDTIADHLARGVALPRTAELQALLKAQAHPMDSPMPGSTSVQ